MTVITDSLVTDHILWHPQSTFERMDILHLAKSGKRKVLNIQERLAQFRWQWDGKESDWATLYAFFEAQTRANSWYLFFPVVRKIWLGVDIPCYPRVAQTTGAMSGITKGADTTINFAAAHGLTQVGTHTYVYITGVVDNGPGGDLEAALNDKLHLVKTWTDADTIVIETDTSGCANAWASDGAATQATFAIRGKSVVAATTVVKEAGGAAKTHDVDYDIEASGGTNGEDLIQLEEAWAAVIADGNAITCGFEGRRRYYVWFADNAIKEVLDARWEGGEFCVTVAFNVNEDVEDD